MAAADHQTRVDSRSDPDARAEFRVVLRPLASSLPHRNPASAASSDIPRARIVGKTSSGPDS